MLGLLLAQFALTPPPPSPSPPPPRPPRESGSGEELTWTTCDRNGPCTNNDPGANFRCTNNGYCSCRNAANCWCDGNNGYCDCGAASRCMCDSNNGHCACPRSGSKCTTTDPFFLDDDDVQQACDFASEFSSDSDFACACAGKMVTARRRATGRSSDSGDSGDGGGWPSSFRSFFCIALRLMVTAAAAPRLACHGPAWGQSAYRASRRRDANRRSGAPPVAVPTCSAPSPFAARGRRPSPCRSTLARRRRSPSPSAPCPSPLRPTSTARLSSCRASRWPPTAGRRRRAFPAARRSDPGLSGA